jgi:hypothetical protein
VDDDGLCTPNDVLLVINYINNGGTAGSGEAEGERVWPAATPSDGDVATVVPRTGDQPTSIRETDLAPAAVPWPGVTSDAVFDVWPDAPWDELADTLAHDHLWKRGVHAKQLVARRLPSTRRSE